MLLSTMNWMQVEHYLEHDDRIVVITGACEQHAYLSLLSDILIPQAIAEEACRQENVLIAPPLPYGISPAFVAYPGTLSLRPETFAGIFRELMGGLLAQGFRRILVNNGHSGNTELLVSLLVELGTAHPGARFSFFEWWRHPAVLAVSEQEALPQYHANWSENFPITRIDPMPEGAKEPPLVPRGTSATVVRSLLGDGSYGGPYQAPDSVMKKMFGAAVDAMAQALRKL